MPEQPKKLLDQVRDALIFKHNYYRSEQSIIDWIIRCILFLQKRHTKDIGELETEVFLAYLAQERHVVASTQNQAFNAFLFLYHPARYHISRIAIDA
jgi:hypothetical protein